jgi:hypothetical protein
MKKNYLLGFTAHQTLTQSELLISSSSSKISENTIYPQQDQTRKFLEDEYDFFGLKNLDPGPATFGTLSTNLKVNCRSMCYTASNQQYAMCNFLSGIARSHCYQHVANTLAHCYADCNHI